MRTVNPGSLMPPRGYNNGALFSIGDGSTLLFVAGQIGTDATGALVGRDFVTQFDRAIANVVAVVREAGGSPESVGKLTIFVTDRTEYAADRRAIGDVYRRHMGRHFPAMSLVEVQALLEPGARVEIEAIAVLEAR